MDRVDRLDQNIATYMTAHRKENWCRPIFRFCLDHCANNALQDYRHQKKNPWPKPLNILGFQCSIVGTYYQRYRKTTQITMFPGLSKKTKVSDEVRFGKMSHWIVKANAVLLYTHALCNLFTDILTIFLCCFLKKVYCKT